MSSKAREEEFHLAFSRAKEQTEAREEYFADLKVQFDEMRISFDRDLTQAREEKAEADKTLNKAAEDKAKANFDTAAVDDFKKNFNAAALTAVLNASAWQSSQRAILGEIGRASCRERV